MANCLKQRAHTPPVRRPRRFQGKQLEFTPGQIISHHNMADTLPLKSKLQEILTPSPNSYLIDRVDQLNITSTPISLALQHTHTVLNTHTKLTHKLHNTT